MGRNGTGVVAVSDSTYEITFSYRGARCRERVKAKPCPANTRKLIDFRKRILFAIEDGSFNYAETFPNSGRAALFAKVPGDLLTVAEYLERWLDVKKTQIAASTHRDYYGIVYRFATPRWGKKPLADLKRLDIKEALAAVRGEVSNKRLSNIQSCLRSALQEAADDELIESNPLAGFTFARNEPPREKDHADPLDAAEQAAVIQHARDPQLANLFRFAFWTGLRTSELIALNWSDIDWRRGEIRVRRAMTRAAKGKMEDTKTVAGRRVVKLLEPARDALLAQKAHTFLAGDAVFHNPGWRGNLEPCRWAGDDQIWEAWGTALKSAKVRYRNPYQTRHTYASMMLSAGESEMWVAKQMGHSDTATIRRNYGRWIAAPDSDAGSKAVEKFAADAGKFAGIQDGKQAKTS